MKCKLALIIAMSPWISAAPDPVCSGVNFEQGNRFTKICTPKISKCYQYLFNVEHPFHFSGQYSGVKVPYDNSFNQPFAQYLTINSALSLHRFYEQSSCGMIGAMTLSEWGRGLKNWEVGGFVQSRPAADISFFASLTHIGRNFSALTTINPSEECKFNNIFFKMNYKEALHINIARDFSNCLPYARLSNAVNVKFFTLPLVKHLSLFKSFEKINALTLIFKLLTLPWYIETDLDQVSPKYCGVNFAITEHWTVNLDVSFPTSRNLEGFGFKGIHLQYGWKGRKNQVEGALHELETRRLRFVIPVTPSNPSVLGDLPVTFENMINYIKEEVPIIGNEQWRNRLVRCFSEHYGYIHRLSEAPNEAMSKEFKKFLLEEGTFFVAGPSGAGKTYMLSTIAKLFEVPFVYINASQCLEQANCSLLDEQRANGFNQRLLNVIYHEVMKYKDSSEKTSKYPIIFIDELDKAFYFKPRTDFSLQQEADLELWKQAWVAQLMICLKDLVDRQLHEPHYFQGIVSSAARCAENLLDNIAISQNKNEGPEVFNRIKARELNAILSQSILCFAGAFQDQFCQLKENNPRQILESGPLPNDVAEFLLTEKKVKLNFYEQIGRLNFQCLLMPEGEELLEGYLHWVRKDLHFKVFNNIPLNRLPKGLETWEKFPKIQLSEEIKQRFVRSVKAFEYGTGFRGWRKEFGGIIKEIVLQKFSESVDFSELGKRGSKKAITCRPSYKKVIVIDANALNKMPATFGSRVQNIYGYASGKESGFRDR